MRDRIAVVIPAFQEAGHIGSVVKSVMESSTADKCLVVNDGSRDGTGREASLEGADVITLPFNLGYGVALQTGVRCAYEEGYDYVVTMDADGQHRHEDISVLLAKIREGNYDLVIGSRFMKGGKYAQLLMRRLGIRFFVGLLKLLSGQDVSDPTSGFLAMNRSAMRFCISDWYPTDYPDTNALFMMMRVGLRITEVSVRMRARKGGRSMHSGLKPFGYLYKVCLSIGVTLFRKLPRNWQEEP